MANATRKEVTSEHIELSLTMSEAVALRTLLAFVGGDPTHPIRKELMHLEKELDLVRIYPQFLVDGVDVGPSPLEGNAGVYFWERDSQMKDACYGG